MPAPTSSADFDRAYRAPLTFWGDVRIPPELKALAHDGAPRRALELGCGVGRFSRYLAQEGLRVTGVDFSAVAVAKARQKATAGNPEFLVGDVTHLDALTGPFDLSFDVGCFHCLDAPGQRAYASEVARLLRPDGTHLIWALDSAPSDAALSPAVVEQVFRPGFTLQRAAPSRRRLAASHWYWLQRAT